MNSSNMRTDGGARFIGLTHDKLILLSSVAQGIEMDEIADMLGVKRSTLYLWLRDMKLSTGAATLAHLVAISIRSRFISPAGKILINLNEESRENSKNKWVS